MFDWLEVIVILGFKILNLIAVLVGYGAMVAGIVHLVRTRDEVSEPPLPRRCFSTLVTPSQLSEIVVRPEFGLDPVWDDLSPPKADSFPIFGPEEVLLARMATLWTEQLQSRFSGVSEYSERQNIKGILQRFSTATFFGGRWETADGVELVYQLRKYNRQFADIDLLGLLDWLVNELIDFSRKVGPFRDGSRPLPTTRIDLSAWVAEKRPSKQ